MDKPLNHATRRITGIIATLLAFAGFEHGLFEVLQGYRPTGGWFIAAIGESMQWWEYGNEGAFTVIHNFLLTGIAAMLVAIGSVVWAWLFVQRRHGVTVLLLLFVLLTAVGGGLGFVPFYLVTCAYASRIRSPLNWWRNVLSFDAKRLLAPRWPHTVALAAVCWLAAIEIAVFGYFPIPLSPDMLLYTCWSFLFAALILINISFIAGFASDIG